MLSRPGNRGKLCHRGEPRKHGTHDTIRHQWHPRALSCPRFHPQRGAKAGVFDALFFHEGIDGIVEQHGFAFREPVAEGVGLAAGALAGDLGVLEGAVEPVPEEVTRGFVEIRGPFFEDFVAGELARSFLQDQADDVPMGTEFVFVGVGHGEIVGAFGVEFEQQLTGRVGVAGEGEEAAAGLRDLLELYCEENNPLAVRQIEGLLTVRSEPVVRRVTAPGPISFARGLVITLTFDEAAFEGMGVFTLGSVLEQFFAKYVSLNSFTETVIRTKQRGEIIRWPTRMGIRQIL